MTTAKIAISLPERLLRQAKMAVSLGRSATVSAYIAEALGEKVKFDDLARLLEEMLEQSGGPLTQVEKRQADRDLGISRSRKRRAA